MTETPSPSESTLFNYFVSSGTSVVTCHELIMMTYCCDMFRYRTHLLMVDQRSSIALHLVFSVPSSAPAFTRNHKHDMLRECQAIQHNRLSCWWVIFLATSVGIWQSDYRRPGGWTFHVGLYFSQVMFNSLAILTAIYVSRGLKHIGHHVSSNWNSNVTMVHCFEALVTTFNDELSIVLDLLMAGEWVLTITRLSTVGRDPTVARLPTVVHHSVVQHRTVGRTRLVNRWSSVAIQPSLNFQPSVVGFQPECGRLIKPFLCVGITFAQPLVQPLAFSRWWFTHRHTDRWTPANFIDVR